MQYVPLDILLWCRMSGGTSTDSTPEYEVPHDVGFPPSPAHTPCVSVYCTGTSVPNQYAMSILKCESRIKEENSIVCDTTLWMIYDIIFTLDLSMEGIQYSICRCKEHKIMHIFS